MSRDLDHAHLGQFVITGLLRAGGKTPYLAVGKQGASYLHLGGGLQLSSAGTDNGATSESCRRAVVCASTITIVANL